MSEETLHDVLLRVTDGIESPDLAATALATVRRRRTRRRGALAAAGGVLAIASVVGAMALVDTTATQEPAPGTPTSTPTGSPERPRLAPEIDPSRMQPIWDPDRIGSMPWDDELGLPQDLTPISSVDLATSHVVAAADHGDLFCLLLPTGEWVNAGGYPEPSLEYVGRTLALSDDGSRIAVTGRTALWWRDIPLGKWTRVDYPAGLRLPTDTSIGLEFGDEGSLLLDHFTAFWTIDLTTGASERLPFDIFDAVTALPDGDFVASRFADTQPPTRVVARYRDGRALQATDPTPLKSLQHAVGSDTSLVATRAYGGGPVPPPETAHDGLLALDLDGLTTRAFLPVKDRRAWYSDAAGLTAVGWLDDDTVLAEVQPKAQVGTIWVITWSVETGELRRVASYPRDVRMAFAIDAL